MIEPGGVESPADEDIPFHYQGETVDIEAALALAMLAPAGRATWQENAGIDEATLARAHDRFEGIGKRLGEPTQSAMLANWHAGLDGQLARLEDALLKDRAHGLPKVSKARKGFERARPEGREADRRHGAKYRAKPEIKERDIVRSKLWRVLNHDKALLQPWIGKQKIMRDLEYHRPFVAIDAEGCDLPGHDIERDGAAYPAHATFLWGASGVSRDAHGTWNGLPLHWLGGRSVRSEVEPNLSSPGRENAAGGDEKRPLKTTEFLIGY